MLWSFAAALSLADRGAGVPRGVCAAASGGWSDPLATAEGVRGQGTQRGAGRAGADRGAALAGLVFLLRAGLVGRAAGAFVAAGPGGGGRSSEEGAVPASLWQQDKPTSGSGQKSCGGTCSWSRTSLAGRLDFFKFHRRFDDAFSPFAGRRTSPSAEAESPGSSPSPSRPLQRTFPKKTPADRLP